jgi:hypothetical protein
MELVKRQGFYCRGPHNDVSGQIIIGFISFGTLHIYTTGLEPWQWYDQGQHITNALTFF